MNWEEFSTKVYSSSEEAPPPDEGSWEAFSNKVYAPLEDNFDTQAEGTQWELNRGNFNTFPTTPGGQEETEYGIRKSIDGPPALRDMVTQGGWLSANPANPGFWFPKRGEPPIDREATINKFADELEIDIITDESGTNIWDEIKFAFTGNEKDARKLWKEKYPNGEIFRMTVPDVGDVLVTKFDADDKEEPYRMVDEVGIDSSDFAETIESIPRMTAQAAAMFHPSLKGAKWLTKALTEGAAGLTAGSVQQGIYASYGLTPDWGRSPAEALLDVGVASGIGLGGRMMYGNPYKDMSQEGFNALRAEASRDTGIDLGADAYTDSPIISKFVSQSAGTGPTVTRKLNRAKDDMSEVIQREIELYDHGQQFDTINPQEAFGLMADKEVDSWIAKRNRPFREALSSAIDDTRVTFNETDAEFRQSLRDWYFKKNDAKDAAYDKAYDSLPEGHLIDISEETLAVAEQIVEGTPWRFAAQRGPDGKFIKGPGKSPIGKGDPKSEIGSIAADMLGLRGKDSLRGQSVEDVKLLRSRLKSMYPSEFGAMDSQQKKAYLLRQALGRDVKESIDGLPKSRELFEKADSIHQQLKTEAKGRIVRQALKDKTSLNLVQDFMEDPDIVLIRELKNMMGPQQLSRVKGSYIGHLTRNPLKIETWLSNLEDKGAKRMMVTSAQENALRQYARSYKKTMSHPYVKVRDEFMGVSHYMNALMKEGQIDRGAMSDIIRQIGGESSSAHNLLKAGFADFLLSKSYTRLPDGKYAFDPKAYVKNLDQWKSSGNRGVLETLYTPAEMAKLENIGVLSSYFTKGADMGSNLESASIVAGAKGLTGLNLKGGVTALHDVMINRTVGSILMSKQMNRFLLGEHARAGKNIDFLKALGMATVNYNSDVEEYIAGQIPKERGHPMIERQRTQ